jgi:hypothetical protein
MPRPYPPPPLVAPKLLPFNLENWQKRELARLLGLPSLPRNISEGIAAAIAAYKATETGSADTTIKNVLEALDELQKSNKGRAYKKAVQRFAHPSSGVDYTTHDALQPLAQAVLDGKSGAKELLAQAARARAEELRQHPRVLTTIEPLLYFCGIVEDFLQL